LKGILFHSSFLMSRVLLALLTWSRVASRTYPRSLPNGPIIAAWQDWSACNETKTLQEVEEGVNVIFWFATDLIKDSATKQPKIVGGPNFECVARVRAAIDELELPCAHLISIGGWGHPHPDTSFSGTEWFSFWNEWNNNLPAPFDGFDWDLEGSDYLFSTLNALSPKLLQLVIDMSVAAKHAGLLVTMAPPQSYFDVTTHQFNRFLNNTDPHFHPDFHYRGRNSYTYLWAAAPAGTFDLVEVQTYETFGPALRGLQSMSGSEYLQTWAADLLRGWVINVTDPLLPQTGLLPVAVPPSRLLIGLSFGGGGGGRSACFWPESIRIAFETAEPSQRPRGYAFWNIGQDGRKMNGTNRSVSLARSLNSFLHVRTLPPEQVRILSQFVV